MASFFHPETALKPAEGLLSVGQTHAALHWQSLTEMFASKRFRSTPLTARIHHAALLMQYKNIAQNTSVASIEVVIKRFIQQTDQRVQDAQNKAYAAFLNTLRTSRPQRAREHPARRRLR